MNVRPVSAEREGSSFAVQRAAIRQQTSVFWQTLSNVQQTAGSSHTVREGDTLWKICAEHVGGGSSSLSIPEAIDRVVKSNGLTDPNRLSTGQALDLSALGSHDTRRAGAEVPLHLPARVRPALISRAMPQGRGGVERSSTRLPEIAQEEAAKTQKTVDLNELMQSILEQAPSGAAVSPPQSPWQPIVGDTAQLSSDFGMRRDPFTRRRQHHNGIDLAVPTGTKVYPCQPGEVVFSGHKGGYGNVVVVRHEDGAESVYGHCSRNLVRSGQRVARNTVLALSGSSGRSTGPHLHFEVRVDDRAVNPMKMLRDSSLEVAKAF